MQNASLRLLVVAGVFVLVLAAFTSANASAAERRLATIAAIDDYRLETWRWQRLMQARRTPTNYAERTAGPAYRLWLLDLWRTRADEAEARAQRPPHQRAWLCIHSHEAADAGGWSTNTGNGYFGGLQMSRQFQQVYAPELLRSKGTADNWTRVEQMWVAERALDDYGFTPWPNTARACGLL